MNLTSVMRILRFQTIPLQKKPKGLHTVCILSFLHCYKNTLQSHVLRGRLFTNNNNFPAWSHSKFAIILNLYANHSNINIENKALHIMFTIWDSDGYGNSQM